MRILALAVAAGALATASCSYHSETATAAQPVVQPVAVSPAPSNVTVVQGSSQVLAESQTLCASYGYTPGTAAYQDCLRGEAVARGHRQETLPQPMASPYAYNPGSSPSYAEATPAPLAGGQAFRDEYGFRYDAQGNRLDRYGNIISPHSTRP